MSDSDNPRMQCERCGKWRRLITKGEQVMHPYYVESPSGEWVDELYDCLCTPFRESLDPKVIYRAWIIGKEFKAT